MSRIIINVTTGEQTTEAWTTEELAGFKIRKAEEDARPNWDGFRLYCMGEIFANSSPGIERLIDAYTSFVVGIQYKNPTIVHRAINNALADHTLDPTKGIPQVSADAIRAAMQTYHLPVVLP